MNSVTLELSVPSQFYDRAAAFTLKSKCPLVKTNRPLDFRAASVFCYVNRSFVSGSCVVLCVSGMHVQSSVHVFSLCVWGREWLLS